MTVFRDSTAIVATSAQLGAVALAHRSYVNRNPRAIVRDRVLMHDGCMQARMISEPLCLCDNCQESDDAIARVLTRADRARDLRRQSAYIHASSRGMTRQHLGGSLSEVCLHGMNPVTEAVRQLRGTACTQISGART